MFGHRSDGKKVRGMDPVFRIMPCIMEERNDSQVYFKQDIPIDGMTEYIKRKAEEGIKISYMNIVLAAMVRIISERQKLNRFIMNGSTYQRKGIFISLTIKKSLTDDGEETVIKPQFTGKENIFEVKDIFDNIIEENKKVEANNNTDKFIKLFNFVPDKVMLWVVKFLKWLDKHGAMPKAIIKLSPFHTSAFLTNVGSLGIDTIYHHIYNFGTTSLFFAMGKKKKSFIYDDEEIKEEKCISIGFVGDERICDGCYYANSFKQLVRYLKKPELLESRDVQKAVKEPTVEQ